MKSIILTFCFMGISQFALAKAPAPEGHPCFRAAKSIAVNKLNKEARNEMLIEAGLDHDRCIWNERELLIECFQGKQAVTDYVPVRLDVKRVSPSRNDLEFDFAGGVQGLDVGVRIRFSSTKAKLCKYIGSELYFEPTGEE